MALTYRSVKGSALTIAELDGNFQHFTGSHSITGSLTISDSLKNTGTFTNNVNASITGALSISGSLTTINYISGSLLTPTSSGTPSFEASDGQFIFGSDSGNYFIYAYLGGAWRSGSLV